MNLPQFCITQRITTPKVAGHISLVDFILEIKNNSNKQKILKLHSLDKTNDKDAYDKIKHELPCIKPNAIFNDYCEKENFLSSTGFMFFDIDSGNMESHYEYLKSLNYIYLLGKSVGGKGLFFWVRIDNPEGITADNFLSCQHYIKNVFFPSLPIDNSSLGLNRNQVIPYDPDVYLNDKATALMIDYNSVKECDSFDRSEYVDEPYLPIDEVNRFIVWKTEYDLEDELYQIGDFQVGNLFIPRIISDGMKHKSFAGIVNVVMFNYYIKYQQHIDQHILQSFLFYVNENHTGMKKMDERELVRLVHYEYDRIISGGEFKSLKTKHVLTNSKMQSGERQRLGCAAYGEYRKHKSKEMIKEVVDLLTENNEKITANNVHYILKGKLSLRTIKTHLSEFKEKSATGQRSNKKASQVVETTKGATGGCSNGKKVQQVIRSEDEKGATGGIVYKEKGIQPIALFCDKRVENYQPQCQLQSNKDEMMKCKEWLQENGNHIQPDYVIDWLIDELLADNHYEFWKLVQSEVNTPELDIAR